MSAIAATIAPSRSRAVQKLHRAIVRAGRHPASTDWRRLAERIVWTMIDYGQFCTVARGAEVFGERWTPLVVRELLCGSTRFNDIRRGVPRMSATLLTQRLRKLEEMGVVKRVAGRRRGREYHLTGAGEELRPIVLALGHWGARWIGSRLKRGQLDAGFLMWDIRRFVASRRVPARPPRRDPLPLHRRAPGERRWWLVVEDGSADLCRDDPGREPTLVVESTVLALTEVWTGDRDAGEAVAEPRGARARRGARRDAPCGAGSAAAPSPGRDRPAAPPPPEPRHAAPLHDPCAPWSRSPPPPGSSSASPSSSSSSPSGPPPPSAASSPRPSSPTRWRWSLGLDAAHQDGLRPRHRHDGVARDRRLRHRRGARASARRGDGRLQADRGLLRAFRRASPATCRRAPSFPCSSSGPASARRRSWR